MLPALLLLLLPVEARLSEFTLQRGAETVTVSPARASATVLVFVSTICPVSDKYVERLNALYQGSAGQGVQFLAVNPNSNESRQDVARYAAENGVRYPMYKDESNRLADRVGARSTPEAFIYDAEGRLRYRGQIDDAVNPARVRSHTLRDALQAVLQRRGVSPAETRALGCAIHRAGK